MIALRGYRVATMVALSVSLSACAGRIVPPGASASYPSRGEAQPQPRPQPRPRPGGSSVQPSGPSVSRVPDGPVRIAGATAVIGNLTQDESIDAAIHVPSMLSKHFAIVGSTGVGKSTAVSLLLRKAIESDPKLRILILDPHNEFAAAFPELAVVIDTDTLDLPFWLMRQ